MTDEGDLSRDPTKFVPLADVPGIVWKTNMNKSDKGAHPHENWNRYADMDLPSKNGKTLFQICRTKNVKVDLAAWLAFYKTAPQPSASKSKAAHVNMGSLPFRVWQLFDAMLEYRADGDKVGSSARPGCWRTTSGMPASRSTARCTRMG